MVICLERGADLHMAQLMPLPLTVQIDFSFLVPAHLGSPRQRAVKRVCVCVFVQPVIQSVVELVVQLTGCTSVYTIQPVVQPVVERVRKCILSLIVSYGICEQLICCV